MFSPTVVSASAYVAGVLCAYIELRFGMAIAGNVVAVLLALSFSVILLDFWGEFKDGESSLPEQLLLLTGQALHLGDVQCENYVHGRQVTRHSSTRLADMNKENITVGGVQEITGRLTRARAKALAPSRALPTPTALAKADQKGLLQPNSKRAALDENKSATDVGAFIQPKRRAVLRDVTNISLDNKSVKCINGTKVQTRKQVRVPKKNTKDVLAIFMDPQVQEDVKSKTNVDMVSQKTEASRATLQSSSGIAKPSNISIRKVCGVSNLMHPKQRSTKYAGLPASALEEEGSCKKVEATNENAILDIDSNHKDPQMCSLYAADVYDNLRALELNRRPSVDYIETLQQDITKDMRGILVDWLVEVCEEYRLAPDTLYLTVNLIDRFLSANFIEKQRLQLLGITCMLIASKYEEICPPRVEEFCFITDSTYTKKEVLKMEGQVLDVLGFQLSVPTTKKFLRRFIHAAQSSSKAPVVELEFLANYLTELTLTEYSFLKFLPSLIAASAIFLARWTLDQADHPWNSTLEHYTHYKTLELKGTVMALQDLQLNTKASPLNAIREKYRQEKFKCVATLSSPKPVTPLS